MSQNIEQDVKFIEALAALLHKTDLAEIEVEREYDDNNELKVRLSRVSSLSAVSAPASAASAQQVLSAPSAPTAQGVSDTTPESLEAVPDVSKHPGTVSSPMVGTVYLAPEPSASAFVKEGDSVKQGQTIMIVEAMKTMNHIHAPQDGTVIKILVEDAQPVEFGMPLLVIE